MAYVLQAVEAAAQSDAGLLGEKDSIEERSKEMSLHTSERVECVHI